jgi:anti-sigma factor RsiW
MMNCDFVVEKIDDYLDGLLEKIEQERFDDHLIECKSCQMMVEDLQQIKSIMNDMPVMPLPNDFNETLHSKLVIAAKELDVEKALLNKQSSKKIIPFPIVVKTLMPYVAAAAVLVVVVISGDKIKDSIWLTDQVVEQASAKIEVQKPLIVAAVPIEVATADKIENTKVEKSAPEKTSVPKTTAPKKSVVKETNQIALLDSAVSTVSESAPVSAVSEVALLSSSSDASMQTTPPAGTMRTMSAPVTAQKTTAPIKDKDIALEIANYQAFYLSVEGLMSQIGGVIESSFSELLPANEKDATTNTQLTGYVILKVPSTKVDAVLEEIKKMGELQLSQVTNQADGQESLLKTQDKQESLTTIYIGVKESSKNEN